MNISCYCKGTERQIKNLVTFAESFPEVKVDPNKILREQGEQMTYCFLDLGGNNNQDIFCIVMPGSKANTLIGDKEITIKDFKWILKNQKLALIMYSMID